LSSRSDITYPHFSIKKKPFIIIPKRKNKTKNKKTKNKKKRKEKKQQQNQEKSRNLQPINERSTPHLRQLEVQVQHKTLQT